MNAAVVNKSENEEQYGALKTWVDSYLSDFETNEDRQLVQQSNKTIATSGISCAQSHTKFPKPESQNIVTGPGDNELIRFDLDHPAKLHHNKRAKQGSGIPLATFLSNGHFSDQMESSFSDQSDTCLDSSPRIVSDDENLEESNNNNSDDDDTWREMFSDIWNCFGDQENCIIAQAKSPSNEKDENIELDPTAQKEHCLIGQSPTHSNNIACIVSDDDNHEGGDKEESYEKISEERNDWHKIFSKLLDSSSDNENCNDPSQLSLRTKRRGRCTLRQHNYRGRQNKETTPLVPIRIETTETLGSEISSSTTNRTSWRHMFTKLKEYRSKYGDCLVPQKFLEDPKLGRWVDKQRHWYKCKKEDRKTSLNTSQIEEMDSIGFVWSINKQRNWAEMFGLLKKYRTMHGNCLVSANCEEYSKLGRWVAQQRHHHKRFISGKSSPMSTDIGRIKKLEEIDFVWNLPRGKIPPML